MIVNRERNGDHSHPDDIARSIMTAQTAAAAASDGAPIAFDPVAPDFIRDPYPHYHRLRQAAPVFRAPFGPYVVTRYEDCAKVLRDRRFGKDFVGGLRRSHGPAVLDEPVYAAMQHWMLNQDPPDHTRLRGLVVKAFTARTAEEMRPRIRAIVDATLDRVESRGRMDAIRDFAYHLPVTVMCELLGIPEADHLTFINNAGQGGRLLDPVPLSREDLEPYNERHRRQTAYFHELFERRRREPGNDLTSLLVQAEEAGEKLSEAELTANIMLLFGAGHETTVNLIGNGLLALHRHPDQLEKLKRDPSLMPNAVEELLRYDASVQATMRTALEDVELGGVPIEHDQAVLCVLGAANRDPAMYEDPDRLDITRPNIRPLSFGGGIHFCIGAQLARIQAEIALNRLFARLPGFRLETPDVLDWRDTFVLRGLKSLPATW
jgi:cytochrome P450